MIFRFPSNELRQKRKPFLWPCGALLYDAQTQRRFWTFFISILLFSVTGERCGQSFHSNIFSLSSDSILLFNTNIISPKGVSTRCVTYKYIFGDENVSRFSKNLLCDRL